MVKPIRKYGMIIIACYIFFAAMILLLGGEHYPLIPTAGVFGGILAVLILYLVLLIIGEKKGKKMLSLEFIHALKKYRFLIEQLVSRDFKTKYKRSVLGILWSFLNPLMTMGIQYIVFSRLIGKGAARGTGLEYYAAYLLAGIVLYNGFLDCSNQAMHAITGNASLVTKVYVPKYIYPVSKVLSVSINTVLTMIPLLIVTMINGVRPSLYWLLLPIPLFLVLLFAVGMGLFLSSILVFFRDIEFLWGVFCSLWMYATPIIYGIDMLPDWVQPLEFLNPMYYYITILRDVVIYHTFPEPLFLLAAFLMGVFMMIVGSLVFKDTQDQFILYL
ncbi:MAG: ABC transporter permease [Lachnospiraceae bacterium]|nr:ABC transporter permease [Lachnospiraceae bacterium]